MLYEHACNKSIDSTIENGNRAKYTTRILTSNRNNFTEFNQIIGSYNFDRLSRVKNFLFIIRFYTTLYLEYTVYARSSTWKTSLTTFSIRDAHARVNLRFLRTVGMNDCRCPRCGRQSFDVTETVTVVLRPCDRYVTGLAHDCQPHHLSTWFSCFPMLPEFV